jgi:hypothetical protein
MKGVRMKQLTWIHAVSFTLLTFALQPAAAQTFVTGSAGGAYYKFAVPPNWNGYLVIWNDGLGLGPLEPFTVDPSDPLAGLGALAPVQFSEGFALAVTSRRQIGWALFHSNNDLNSMMDQFVMRFGNPSGIFVTGGSFGGLVAIQAVESAHLGNVVGGLSLCGTLGGSRNWDLALDLRLIYDAVCSSVPGAAIPGGAEGLPRGTPLDNITISAVAAGLDQCTGILTPPALQTQEQQARLATILAATGLPPTFLLTDMIYSTLVMSDLVHDPTKLSGKIGTGTAADYGGLDVETVIPNPGAKRKLEDHYTPDGVVGAARIVSLHTDKDGLSIVENESDYSEKISKDNFTSAIVVEETPTHCGFTPAETVAAWESLVGWVGGAPQPSPTGIEAACQLLESQGFTGPCRIDPSYVVPSIDGRIRPR